MIDNNEEFIIQFSDLTMIKTGGVFDSVSVVMDADNSDCKWMIETVVTIAFDAGMTTFQLHLYHNADVYIMDYAPSSYDVLYNMDIQYLSMWLQSHGWHVPEPYPDLVRLNFFLWKQHWETSLINSKYLKSKIGKRIAEFEGKKEEEVAD